MNSLGTFTTLFLIFFQIGTNTGKALNYTLDVLFRPENGNRQAVPDIIVLLTDGRSQDDVFVPAQRLRDSGATVKVGDFFAGLALYNFNQINFRITV